MNTTTRDYPRGDLRVSDADRDRALAELSGHFQAGRLTPGEFDERSGRALRARTGTELAGLLADLPREDAAATGTVARAGSAGPLLPRRGSTGRIAIVAGAVVAVVAVLGAARGGHHGLIALVPVLAVLLVVGRLARRWHGGERS